MTGTAYYRQQQSDGGGQGFGDVDETFKANDDAKAEAKAQKLIKRLHGSWGQAAGFDLELREVRVVKKFDIPENSNSKTARTAAE